MTPPVDFTKKQHITNYIITYVAYGMGGIMFFYLKPLPKIVFFIYLLYLLAVRKDFIQPKFFLVIGVIGILFLIQKYQFGIGTFYNYSGFVAMFGIGYLLVKLLKEHFIDYFINVVYFFCYVSLFFWLLTNIVPGFYELTVWIGELFGRTDPSGMNESFLIYAVEPYLEYLGIRRNNGGFWEPGVYATMLAIALLFSVLKNSLKNRKSRVILFTLLTTMSTAGFAALFFILLVDLNIRKIDRASRLVIKIFVMIVVLTASFSLDFLAPKLIKQFDYQSEVDLETTYTSGRFLGARKSLLGLSRHPYFGKGLVIDRTESLLEVTIYKDDEGIYGIMGMLQRVGIFAFILFMIPIYKGFEKILPPGKQNYWNTIYCLMVWLVLMFSQALFWVPVSLYIFWYSLILKEKNIL